METQTNMRNEIEQTVIELAEQNEKQLEEMLQDTPNKFLKYSMKTLCFILIILVYTNFNLCNYEILCQTLRYLICIIYISLQFWVNKDGMNSYNYNYMSCLITLFNLCTLFSVFLDNYLNSIHEKFLNYNQGGFISQKEFYFFTIVFCIISIVYLYGLSLMIYFHIYFKEIVEKKFFLIPILLIIYVTNFSSLSNFFYFSDLYLKMIGVTKYIFFIMIFFFDLVLFLVSIFFATGRSSFNKIMQVLIFFILLKCFFFLLWWRIYPIDITSLNFYPNIYNL